MTTLSEPMRRLAEQLADGAVARALGERPTPEVEDAMYLGLGAFCLRGCPCNPIGSGCPCSISCTAA